MTKSTSLHELIRMIGEGDQTAFSELYDQMRLPVYNHILNKYRVLTEEDAEDIVHTTFMVVIKYAASYRGLRNEISARSWIMKIARSQALKMTKSLDRISVWLDDEPNDDFAVSERNSYTSDKSWEGDGSVEYRAIKKSLLKKIFSGCSLSGEEKEIIELRYEHDYTFEQIGSRYGRSKPRAKQKHDSIIKKIRKALGLDID